jgi:cation:H+ antiporter
MISIGLLISLLIFAVAVAILLVGADLLVAQASHLARHWRISPLIIGTTLVALGTSCPELVISLTSAARGHSDLAMSNIIGSNITNVLLILGLAVLLGSIHVGSFKTQRSIWTLLGSALLFMTLTLIGIPWLAGGALLLGALGFSCLAWRWGIHGGQHEDKKLFTSRRELRRMEHDLGLGILALLAVIGGGLLAVIAIEQLTDITGFSASFFGLTLTAAATSLPELFVTLLSVRRHENKLALGNIIGSNIYNVLLIGGLISWWTPPTSVTRQTWWFFVFATMCLFTIVLKYRRQPIAKWVGGALLLSFLVYLVAVTYYG